MFTIQAVSGDIARVIGRALAVAKKCPNESFRLKFNDVSIYIDPQKDLAAHLEYYWLAVDKAHAVAEESANVV